MRGWYGSATATRGKSDFGRRISDVRQAFIGRVLVGVGWWAREAVARSSNVVELPKEVVAKSARKHLKIARLQEIILDLFERRVGVIGESSERSTRSFAQPSARLSAIDLVAVRNCARKPGELFATRPRNALCIRSPNACAAARRRVF